MSKPDILRLNLGLATGNGKRVTYLGKLDYLTVVLLAIERDHKALGMRGVFSAV